jgi:hypothetical protein
MAQGRASWPLLHGVRAARHKRGQTSLLDETNTMMNWTKTKHVPMDMYKVGEDFDPKAALAFSREQAPPSYLAIMTALQDRIADAVLLVSAMATAKESGFLAHAAGQLNALQELWDDLEAKRAEASKLS